jgi:hypothetical protein
MNMLLEAVIGRTQSMVLVTVGTISSVRNEYNE